MSTAWHPPRAGAAPVPSGVAAAARGALMAGFSAASVFLGAGRTLKPPADHGVPRSWWPRLGAAEAVGAAGLWPGRSCPAGVRKRAYERSRSPGKRGTAR